MAQALQWTGGTPGEAVVNARLAVGGVSVELVRTPHATGEITNHHVDNILCRFVTPSRLRSNVTGGYQVSSIGKLLFVPAGVSNRSDGDGQQSEAIICRFDDDWMKRVTHQPIAWDRDNLRRCGNLSNGRIDQAMQWLASEANGPGLASTILCESLSSLIAVELARHFTGRSATAKSRSNQGRLSPAMLERIRDFIASESPCPSTEAIAAMCRCSPAHLRRVFKATTGQTLSDYATGIRLERAKTLLAQTDMPVTDIAVQMGFSSLSGFSFSFHKASGMTARDYRFWHRR